MSESKRQRAADILLDELHGLLADSMVAKLQKHRKENTEPEAAFISQVIKFLKDNGIDAPLKAGGKLDNLRQSLPSFSDEDAEPGDHTAH